MASGNLPGPFSADIDVLARPWMLELDAISVPLVVGYSADDPVIPPDLVERQLERLQSSHLHRFPTGGHFLPMGKWDELLREAAGVT